MFVSKTSDVCRVGLADKNDTLKEYLWLEIFSFLDGFRHIAMWYSFSQGTSLLLLLLYSFERLKLRNSGYFL